MWKLGILLVAVLLQTTLVVGQDCTSPEHMKVKNKECGNKCVVRKRDADNCRVCECDMTATRMGCYKFDSEKDKDTINWAFNTTYWNEVAKPKYEQSSGSLPDGVRAGAGSATSTQYWDIYRDSDGNPLVPYEFASSLTDEMEGLILQAMNDYVAQTCIRFVERTTQASYVRFMDNGQGGCWSNVGRASPQPNQINLDATGCDDKGVIVHEILHALGWYHEQERPDRDQHIKVIEANIDPDFLDQFEITQNIDSRGSSYDIGSVMQYSTQIFKRDNAPYTMTDLNDNDFDDQTQQERLSTEDIAQIDAVYQCSAITTTPTTTTPTTTTPTTTTPTTTTPTTTTPTTPPDPTATTTTPTTTTPTTTMTPTTTTPTTTTPTTTTPTTTTPTTTTPTTTTPTTTTPTTTPTLQCNDNIATSECMTRESAGLCYTKRAQSKRDCEGTCGLCDCEDNINSRKCRKFWRNHQCTKVTTNRPPGWYYDNCRLTCRLCDNDVVPTSPPTTNCFDRIATSECITRKIQGKCYEKRAQNKFDCEHTCDLCECEDTINSGRCRKFWRNHQCTKVTANRPPGWYYDNCRLTCRFCDSDP